MVCEAFREAQSNGVRIAVAGHAYRCTNSMPRRVAELITYSTLPPPFSVVCCDFNHDLSVPNEREASRENSVMLSLRESGNSISEANPFKSLPRGE